MSLLFGLICLFDCLFVFPPFFVSLCSSVLFVVVACFVLSVLFAVFVWPCPMFDKCFVEYDCLVCVVCCVVLNMCVPVVVCSSCFCLFVLVCLSVCLPLLLLLLFVFCLCRLLVCWPCSLVL